MIRKLVFTMLTITLVGCAHMQGKPPGNGMQPRPTGDTAGTTEGFEFRKIDREIFERLGLKPDDLLLASPRDSQKTIIYLDKNTRDNPNTARGQFTPNRQLTGFVQIFSLRGSPECKWIQDGVGGEAWLPWPECPH